MNCWKLLIHVFQGDGSENRLSGTGTFNYSFEKDDLNKYMEYATKNLANKIIFETNTNPANYTNGTTLYDLYITLLH